MKSYSSLIACNVRFAIALVCSLTVVQAITPDATSDYDYEPPRPGTYTLPAIQHAADGAVLDTTGRALRLRELTRGKITVLSFIYTRCAAAKACPYATGVLYDLYRASRNDATLRDSLRLISLSFDPGADTPKQMAAYSAVADGEDPAAEWHFLTTASASDLRPILTGYGQVVDRRSDPNDPSGPLSHTLRVFLIDTEGKVRNIYSSGTLDPRLVVADIKTVAAQTASRTARVQP